MHLQNAACRNEIWDKTKAVIDGLPENQQEAIDYFYNQGLGIDEIAKLLDLSWDTVRNRIRRALWKLRKKLDPGNNSIAIFGEYANAI